MYERVSRLRDEMSRASNESMHPARRRDVLAIVVSVVMAFLSLTKAWLFFLTAPALLVAIPLLFSCSTNPVAADGHETTTMLVVVR